MAFTLATAANGTVHHAVRRLAAIAQLQPLHAEPSRTRARARGGLDARTARIEVDADRIAAIRFCFDGTIALQLARGGADPKTDAKVIRARILVRIDADDPFISREQRAARRLRHDECCIAVVLRPSSG